MDGPSCAIFDFRGAVVCPIRVCLAVVVAVVVAVLVRRGVVWHFLRMCKLSSLNR